MKKPSEKYLSVRKMAGFHADIPLKDGATNMPLQPRRHPIQRVSGRVWITDESPHYIVAGVDAYTSALHHAYERNIAVEVSATRIPASDLTTEFWSQWPDREIALTHYGLEDRIMLLVRLLRTSHCSVMGHSTGELASRFGCSRRSVRRARKKAGVSRTYTRRKTIVEAAGTTI
jgi:hypothetical protein